MAFVWRCGLYIPKDPPGTPWPLGFLAGIILRMYLTWLGWQEGPNPKVWFFTFFIPDLRLSLPMWPYDVGFLIKSLDSPLLLCQHIPKTWSEAFNTLWHSVGGRPRTQSGLDWPVSQPDVGLARLYFIKHTCSRVCKVRPLSQTRVFKHSVMMVLLASRAELESSLHWEALSEPTSGGSLLLVDMK